MLGFSFGLAPSEQNFCKTSNLSYYFCLYNTEDNMHRVRHVSYRIKNHQIFINRHTKKKGKKYSYTKYINNYAKDKISMHSLKYISNANIGCTL